MTSRITIMIRGGHQVVLQGVDEEKASLLVARIRTFFDHGVPHGSTAPGDGTLIRNSEIVAVRDVSEQELSRRTG